MLTPKKQKNTLLLFLEQFLNLFMVFLLVASLLCIVSYMIDGSDSKNLYLGFVLMGVVVLNCIISLSQQIKSHKVTGSAYWLIFYGIVYYFPTVLLIF